MLLTFYVSVYIAIAAASLYQARQALRYAKKLANVPATGSAPPLTIIKPVRGANEFTRECFESWLGQRYDGEVQFIFSLQDPNDPALAILEELRRHHRFEILVNPVRPGWSGKTSNLHFGIAAAKHELLVLSDADMLAPAGSLATIARLSSEPRALVSCLPRHTHPGNLWARLYAVGWNAGLLCLWAPSMIPEGKIGVSGGTVALQRSELARLGGVEAFGRYLAEDMELGSRANAAGMKLRLGPPLESPVGSMGARDLFHKFLRANLVLIHMKPGLLLSLAIYAWLYGYLAIGLAALATGDPGLWRGFAILLAARFAMLSAIDYLAEERLRPFVEFPLGDFAITSTFVIALVKKTVIWGGVRHRIRPDGQIY